MIHIKLGVVIAGLHDTSQLEPIMIAHEIWQIHQWGPCAEHPGQNCVWITGGIDGNHSKGSYHYCRGRKRGQGNDMRIPLWGTPESNNALTQRACVLLEENLQGTKWEVINEKNHIHFEPK